MPVPAVEKQLRIGNPAIVLGSAKVELEAEPVQPAWSAETDWRHQVSQRKHYLGVGGNHQGLGSEPATVLRVVAGSTSGTEPAEDFGVSR